MITVQQLANKYDVSTTAIHKWIKRGLEHQYRVIKGKKPFIVFKLKDVKEWRYQQFKAKYINLESELKDDKKIDIIFRSFWKKCGDKFNV